MKYKVLDLFSGIGGFSLGLERTGGFETVAFCEIEKYPRYVLQKHWPDVPIFEDVKDLYWFDVGDVDVICGGFPCQDISVAGKQKGLKGERSGLWSEFKRLIEDFQPKWAIIENVSNLRSKGLTTVLQDLWEIGYDAQWHCIPASALGAPHRRDRIWIIAYPRLSVPNTDEVQCSECRREQEERTKGSIGCSEVGLESRGCVPHSRISDGDDKETDTQCAHTLCERHQLQEVNKHRGSELRDEQVGGSDSLCGDVPNTGGEGLQRCELIREVEQRKGTWLCESLRSAPQQNTIPRAKSYWAVEPRVGRVVNGVPKRVDRIKCLGNAVVPIIPQLIGEAILKCDRDMADFCDLL